VRVAIVGYGLAGAGFHAPLIAATPGLEVAAIVSANPERRAQASRAFPDAALLSTAGEIWSDASRYDLVVVAAPNREHAPLAIDALAAGLPVVVDKPMATSVADAEQMLAAAREGGRLLTVFQNRRWDTDFLTARRLIDEGALGVVTRLESRFERYSEPRQRPWEQAGPGGGVVYDLGSHLIDQACVLFDRPTHVYAELDRRRPGTEVVDDAFVALRFPGEVNVHLWMSAVAAIPGPRLRVSGLGGAYEHPYLDPQEDALRSGAHPGDRGWGAEPRERWGRLVTGTGEAGAVEPVPGAYERFYAGVRDAVASGTAPPVGPRDGMRSLEVIEAAERSARESSVVELAGA
jgi:scyllo-inositol 2-dehydrogenase (NADP+)